MKRKFLSLFALVIFVLCLCEVAQAQTRSRYIGGPGDQGYIQFYDATTGSNILTFAAGSITLSNVVIVGGSIASATISGATVASQTIGALTVQSNAVIGTTLTALGATILGTTLAVSNGATVGGTLAVTGVASLSGTTTAFTATSAPGTNVDFGTWERVKIQIGTPPSNRFLLVAPN